MIICRNPVPVFIAGPFTARWQFLNRASANKRRKTGEVCLIPPQARCRFVRHVEIMERRMTHSSRSSAHSLNPHHLAASPGYQMSFWLSRTRVGPISLAQISLRGLTLLAQIRRAAVIDGVDGSYSSIDHQTLRSCSTSSAPASMATSITLSSIRDVERIFNSDLNRTCRRRTLSRPDCPPFLEKPCRTSIAVRLVLSVEASMMESQYRPEPKPSLTQLFIGPAFTARAFIDGRVGYCPWAWDWPLAC